MKMLTMLFALTVCPAFGEQLKGLIQLKAPLDEPEFYCLDVPGFRDNVQLEAPLMAHTCKPGAADEVFTVNRPSDGQISIEAYDLCVQAEGKQLFLRSCSDDSRQRFEFASGGRLKPAGTELCVAIAPGDGARAGGPSHLRRDLGLEACADVPLERSQWEIGVKAPPKI